MEQIYIPMDAKIQNEWFKWAGVERPQDPKAVRLVLFGIAYTSYQEEK
jgi:hypothetical protein